MHDLEVRIGNLGGSSSILNPQFGGLHSMVVPNAVLSLSVYCEPYGYGRHLTISKSSPLNGQIGFSLCEVAVFQIENGKHINFCFHLTNGVEIRPG